MSVKVISRMQEFLNASDDQLEVAMEEIGLLAERYAKEEAPFDTGRLKNSISHDSDKDSAVIGTNVEYAPYQEFGTVKQPGGHPFLRPSVQNHIGEYRNRVLTRLRG